MNDVPQRPIHIRLNLAHLKKQAKELLGACRERDRSALDRVRAALPAAAGRDDGAIVAMDLRLHDAQSCIAREYGFASWSQLKDYMETQAASVADTDAVLRRWTLWTFGEGYQSAKPQLAARLLREHPRLLGGSPSLACAVGDAASARKTIADDASWARTRSSADAMSPLMCACLSGLIRLPEFAQGIRDCAALLLAEGTDANDSMIDPTFHDPLSALYGAAGRNHDVELTRLLLQAGANPNDGESLYHAAEATDSECVRLLLEAGASATTSTAR